MKIGILTQPLRYNYGGILQNMALQMVLRKAGHEVCTLDYAVPSKSAFALFKWEVKKRLRHLLSPGKYPIVEHIPTDAEKDVMFSGMDSFMSRWIVRSPRFRKEEDFGTWTEVEGFDAFIVGSDQCWRLRYNAFIRSMFLSFAKDRDVKRVAYAASFGTAAWEYPDALREECSSLLSKFDGVSVREDSGIALCEENLGVRPVLALDPTMLLPKEEYARIADAESAPHSPGNLFVHILDPDEGKKAAVGAYSKRNGLSPFSILPRHQVENLTLDAVRHDMENCVYASPARFLRSFQEADEVIVDSFHGCVFAIIFNKPFWVVANGKRGNARFDSLLGMLSLGDRLVSLEELPSLESRRSIGWDHVNAVLGSMRAGSLDFLFTSLGLRSTDNE